jgi:hypothetical protein
LPHSHGSPDQQTVQWPQAGRKAITTRVPGFSRAPGPAVSTRATASWPSAIGSGRGRSAFTTERSLWHRPAASMRTSTSPGPGGARSSVFIVSGWLVA